MSSQGVVMKLQSGRWWAFVAANCTLGAAVWAPLASAQSGTADPKARYDRDIARCNRGTLPAPAREACIRQAGLAFDKATGGITGTRETTSPDGRATVMEPSTGSANPGGSTGFGPRTVSPAPPLVTTPDGRATVVNPAAP
jgi:hypothetical protein